MSQSRSHFDILYDHVISTVDQAKLKFEKILNSNNYTEVVNFRPAEAYEPVLNACEHLEDYFNGAVRLGRREHPDFDRFLNASTRVSELGEYMDTKFRYAFNDHRLKLYSMNVIGLNDDNMQGVRLQNASILPTSPVQQSQTSLSSMLTLPNLLLLFIVGWVLKELGIGRPINHGAKLIYHSIFGKQKKEKNDSPVADVKSLSETARLV